MIASGIQTDAKVGAEKRGSKLGDQLFYGVCTRAELAGEIAVEPQRVARPMYVMPMSA
jgi:hypothetical protein